MSSSGSEHHLNREDDAPLVIRRNLQRKTNLYVKNFGDDMNESKLCKLFDIYGTITSCKIPKDRNDRSMGFGFVNFRTSSMAEDALNNLNGYLLKNGNKLYVNYFQNKQDRQEEQQQTYYKTCEDRNLFISNLDESINDRRLKHAFDKYGTIISAKVMLKDGRSKGYGFVCFRTVDEASEAINDMNGKELGSKPIYVTLCKGQKEHSQSSNDRYLQQTNDTQKFHSIPRPRNVANYSEIPSTSSNRQTSSIVQFSNRLPSRLYLPFNYHQLQLDSSLDNHYSALFLSALKSKQSMYRDENNSSTDDDEKNNHE